MLPQPPLLRVLVADDSAPVRERLVSMLNELPGVEVAAETADVPGTVANVRRLAPDLVILDIGMPGGCGLDVLEIIHAERVPSRVVIVTNYADAEYEARARLHGAAAFFNKSQDFLKAIDFVRGLAGSAHETAAACPTPHSND